MIDFRYHLVSIIAVFLALAVGLAVGSTYLPSAVEGSLHKAEKLAKQQNSRLLQTNTQLNHEASVNQAFAQTSAKRLIGGLLTGQHAVLVLAPGDSSSVVSGVTKALQQSGATVTGQVSLQSQFFDSSESAETKLSSLAGSLAGDIGISLSSQSASSVVSAQGEAAQVLATALTDPAATDGASLGSAEIDQVLDGLSQAGYLQISQSSGATTLNQATMAVVVAPGSPPTTNDSSPDNLALVAVAQQLQSVSHAAVLVGSENGSGTGSAIADVAGAGVVSTVDDADQTVGQIITIQALAKLLAGQSPQSYGVGPGAVPSPAPTPSVSADPTPTTTPTHHAKKTKKKKKK